MHERRRRSGPRSSAEGAREKPNRKTPADGRAGLETRMGEKEAKLGRRRRMEEIGPVWVTSLEHCLLLRL
jgi:hypothetical protein